MTFVDKSKHKYGWWLNIDIELHCYCGEYIQICDGDEQVFTCSNCGQQWMFYIEAKEVEEE